MSARYLVPLLVLVGIVSSGDGCDPRWQSALQSRVLAQDVTPAPAPTPASVPAIDPQAALDAIKLPTYLQPTDWVFIDASQSQVKNLKLRLGPDQAAVDRAHVRMMEGAKAGTWQFGFGLEAQGYVIMLLYGTVGDEAVVRMHRIDVGKPAPGPSPAPTPGPSPGPAPGPAPGPLPPGRYGFAQFAFDEASKLPAEVRRRAADVAGLFESVAAEIAAGSLSDGQLAVNKIGAEAGPVLGADKPAWRQWFIAWSVKAQGHGDSFAAQEAFEETAQGLRAVR